MKKEHQSTNYHILISWTLPGIKCMGATAPKRKGECSKKNGKAE